MSRRVGVDLTSTRAVLASVGQVRQGLQLRGFAVLDAEGATAAIADDLKRARRTNRFPRTAEVVAWQGDRRVEAVRQSGFRVERTITPGEALARVARLHHQGRPGSPVTAVVSLHPTSGAVAIVRDGRLLFESQLAWSVAATPSDADSGLLRRYTFVSELTESLRRVFELVRARQSAEVTEILTCGSLTDLRSLTMPLAAEFDVEVETLDSTDAIDVRVRDASPQQMRDTIASLWLAIAAGKRWRKRGISEIFHVPSVPRLPLAARVGLAVAAGAILVFLWVRYDRPASRLPIAPAPRTNATARSDRSASGRTGAKLPNEAAGRSARAAASAPRVVVAPPPLAARQLRVMARLPAAPRGLQHTQLLLALARAEQAIATPRQTPRAAAAPAPTPPPATAKTAPSVAKAVPTPPPSAPKTAPTVAKAVPTPSLIAPKTAPRVAKVVPTPPPSAPKSAPSVAKAVPTPAPSAPKSAPRVAKVVPTPAPSAPKAAPRVAKVVPTPPPSAPRNAPPDTVRSASAAAPKPSPERAASPISPVAPPAPPREVATGPARLPRTLTPGTRPLPASVGLVVSSILWSSDRQLAVVNSRIVAAGDVIGTHTVVEILADAVVFRDRAGRLRRAGLRQGS